MSQTGLTFRDSLGSGTVTGQSTTATALVANPNRTYFQIQNMNTTPLYVFFGAGASGSNYHFILKGGTGSNDGTGGSYSSGATVWRGLVTVYGSGGQAYTILEL